MLDLRNLHSGDEEEERVRVRELQAGSEEAFDWLIHQYASSVFGLANRVLNDPADTSDTVQEVFLRVFRNIGRFQGNCSLKTWIYRITLHTAFNENRWWRRHREREFPLETSQNGDREMQYIGSDSGLTPFEFVLSRETQEIVRKALLRLSESSRTVLVLREIEGLSYEEVAEVLRVSLGTVKSRLARARRSLRHELEPMMEPAPARIPVWNPAE